MNPEDDPYYFNRNAVYYYNDGDERNGVYYYSDDERNGGRNAAPRVRTSPPWAPPSAQQQQMQPYQAPPQTIVVQQPAPPQRQRVLGINASTGQLLSTAAAGLAAFWPMPDPPVLSGDAGRDLAASVKYQTDIAGHVKLGDKIRAIAMGAALLLG